MNYFKSHCNLNVIDIRVKVFVKLISTETSEPKAKLTYSAVLISSSFFSFSSV